MDLSQHARVARALTATQRTHHEDDVQNGSARILAVSDSDTTINKENELAYKTLQ